MSRDAPRRLLDDGRRLAWIFVGAFASVACFAGAIVVHAWPLALVGTAAAALTGLWVRRRELARRGAIVAIECAHTVLGVLAFTKVRFEHDGQTVVGWSYGRGGLLDNLVVLDRTNARRWALMRESSIVSREEARARPLTPTLHAFAESRASTMIDPALMKQIASVIPPEAARELQQATAERDVVQERWHKEASLIAQSDADAIARTRARVEDDKETRGEFVHWARTTLRWRERVALESFAFWRDAMWRHRLVLTQTVTVVSLVLLVPIGALVAWLVVDDAVRGALGGTIASLTIGLVAGIRAP